VVPSRDQGPNTSTRRQRAADEEGDVHARSPLRGPRACAVVALAAAASLAVGADSCEEALVVSTDRHLLVANGGLPRDLDARVAGLGGALERVHAGAGLAIASGLSDAAAEELARETQAEIVREIALPVVPVGHGIVAGPAAGGVASHDPTLAPLLPLQWDMRRIHAVAAWREGFRGDPGVSVAIVDTGIDPDHVDLRGLVDAGRSIALVPSLEGPPDWVDDNLHGTHVAGTVVSNGVGTSGVAPHTTLIAVKVCDAGGNCALGDVLFGILHAADVGADVVNLSISGRFSRAGRGLLVAALKQAVNHATAAGTLVVMAAGNRAIDMRFDGNRINWPCEAAVGVCVSATDRQDLPTWYTNHGTNVISVAAPGGNTIFGGNSPVLAPCSSHSLLVPECRQSDDVYIFLEGTSMAAPHVAGAAALLDAQYGGTLDPPRLRALLEQTATDLGPPGADPFYGKGFLDACRLVGCDGGA
jgi:hypothetical protein